MPLAVDFPEWTVPGATLDLSPGEIHVWRADIASRETAIATLERILSPDELNRANRFRWERDRRSYIVARGALRDILARYLNREPAGLTFRYGPHGKPSLVESDLSFNVSHASGLALYAISQAQIGIDVKRVLPAEQGSSRRAPESAPPLRPPAFFQLWTRGEAVLKALGLGPYGSLRKREDLPDLAFQRDGWWLYEFIPRDGFVATIASRGVEFRLRHFEWDSYRRIGLAPYPLKSSGYRSESWP